MEHGGKPNIVGPQIRRLRTNAKLSQGQLAAKCHIAGCDISRGTLAKIEAQIRGISDLELYTIALVLRVDLEQLYSADLRKKLAQRLKSALPK